MHTTCIPQCPRRCYDKELYVERVPNRDTANSWAYLCCACGTIFYIFRGK